MFSKKKRTPEFDPEHHELLENAQKRIRQKKRLYSHMVIFLLGSVFMVLINKILKYQEQYDWYIWGITFWAFLLTLHYVNVFFTQKFMGKKWERKQREKLVAKQRKRIAELQKEIQTDFPLNRINKKKRS